MGGQAEVKGYGSGSMNPPYFWEANFEIQKQYDLVFEELLNLRKDRKINNLYIDGCRISIGGTDISLPDAKELIILAPILYEMRDKHIVTVELPYEGLYLIDGRIIDSITSLKNVCRKNNGTANSFKQPKAISV